MTLSYHCSIVTQLSTKHHNPSEPHMDKQLTPSLELSQDQQDMLRSLLDSEIVLIGGGDVIGCLN